MVNDQESVYASAKNNVGLRFNSYCLSHKYKILQPR
jgi:hypothetical protein